MIEVELKARVGDPEAVEAAVASFARFDCAIDKLDAYWHGPDWRLKRGTRGFRMRAEGDTTTVTFKSKRCEGGIEINREREFVVSEPAAFVEFIERLGCEPFYTKRKTGKRYEINVSDSIDESAKAGSRPIVVELVEVEGLGHFIEIEALLDDEEPAGLALAQGEIRGILSRSGVSASEIEPRYYSELLMEAGKIARP